MDNYAEIARELGALNARMDAHNEAMSAQNVVLANLTAQMASLTAFMNQHKGGMRMLVMVATAAGAAGTGLAWLVNYLHGGGSNG